MNILYSGNTISFHEFDQDSYATGEGFWDSNYGYLFVVCDGVGGDRKQAYSAEAVE